MGVMKDTLPVQNEGTASIPGSHWWWKWPTLTLGAQFGIYFLTDMLVTGDGEWTNLILQGRLDC